jgi:hypothetical protein
MVLLPSVAKLPLVDEDSMLPAVARWDIANDGLDEAVSTVTDVDVPSLMLTVSMEPSVRERLSRVVMLVVVMMELR